MTSPPSSSADAPARTLPYQPALDGVRAVAVSLVLAFHAGASWMTGGYVGVSVFFTLSGYLITSLLLAEHDRTGSVALGAFYGRRMKRLLPAGLACLGVTAALAAAGAFGDVADLRRDVLGALLQVANWVKLLGDASYADLTNATLGRVGPLEHYWSLSIEEQFYWLWPLAMVVILRYAADRRSRLRVLGAITVVAALAAPVIADRWGADAAYWATPARAGEILVGALLAAFLHGRARLERRSTWLVPIGLAVIVWAASTWPSGSGPAYRGWLPVFALATAAVIVGLQHESRLRRVLSAAPLVWLGTISYGVYLYHWPVFALVTQDNIGRSGWMLVGARLIVTTGVAQASYLLLERPVRRWVPRRPTAPVLSGLAFTAAAAIVALVTLQPASAATITADPAARIVPADGTVPPLAAARAVGVEEVIATVPVGAASSTTTSSTLALPGTTLVPSGVSVAIPEVSRPVRIIVVGDSTAQHTARGMAAWSADHPATAQITDAAEAGCGFLRDGVVPTDGTIDWTAPCRSALDDELPALITELQPDVVVLMVTMRDVEDRRWSDDEGVLAPTDPRFRSRLLRDYRAIAESLLDAGVDHLAWVLPPNPISQFQGEQVEMLDPARYEVQFDVIRAVAAEHPDRIGVLDLHAWMGGSGLAADGSLRPDGLHWSPEFAYELSERYLIGSVVNLALS